MRLAIGKRRLPLLILLCSLAAASSAVTAGETARGETARIWRCENAQKQQITYSDQPCDPQAPQNGAVQITPNVLNTARAREAALRAELARLRREVAELKAQQQAERARQAPAPAANNASAAVNSLACNEARRAYEQKAFTSRDRVALEAQRDIMLTACGLPLPAVQEQNVHNQIRLQTPSYHYALPALPAPPPAPEITPPAPPPAFAPAPGCRILPNGGFRCPTLIH